ncbi:MAG: hypothetical protein ACRC8S_19755 [Fimbriiglobus sp.]
MNPGMMLVVSFLGCLVGFTAIFLGVAAFLQPLLYSTAAERMILRSLVAGLLMAIVVTGWAYLNTRASHKDKYGTFFEFNATAVRDINEFEAIRRLPIKDENGAYKETTVLFKWQPGGGPNGGQFLEAESQKAFNRSSSTYITSALKVKDLSGEWKKYVTATDGTKYTGLEKASDPLVFKEEGGVSFLSDENLRKVETPSTSGSITVLLINVLHFVAWLIALWPIMRYHVGHALIMVCLFGGVSMFILMPLLFNTNTLKPVRVVAQATAPAGIHRGV